MRRYRVADMDVYPSEDPPVRLEWLREMVDELPEYERTCLELHYFGQWTRSAIAEETKTTVDRVASAIRRGESMLHEQMQEADGVGSLSAGDRNGGASLFGSRTLGEEAGLHA